MIFLSSHGRTLSTLLLVPLIALGVCRFAFALSSGPPDPKSVLPWQSPARMHHLLRRETGILVFSHGGVEFRTRSGASHVWSFTEVKTFNLTPRGFILTTYQNKGWHLPGDRQYRFHLARSIPADVAAGFARLVGKPAINGDPGSQPESFASLPARHRTLTGGTNGTLQFSEGGIAYSTVRGKGGRSWRWTDIQTIAHPDPYHFTVGGYRETYRFELKQPMSQALFDRVWDRLYARGLQTAFRNSRYVTNVADARQQNKKDQAK